MRWSPMPVSSFWLSCVDTNHSKCWQHQQVLTFWNFYLKTLTEGRREKVLWILFIRFSAIIYFLFLLCPVFWILSHPLALELNYMLLICAFCCSCSMPCRAGIKPIGVTETKPDNKDTAGGKNPPPHISYFGFDTWKWSTPICSDWMTGKGY